MQRENEWLPEATMSQCSATQRSWSPNAQPMSDLLWHGSCIHGRSEARDSRNTGWLLWVRWALVLQVKENACCQICKNEKKKKVFIKVFPKNSYWILSTKLLMWELNAVQLQFSRNSPAGFGWDSLVPAAIWLYQRLAKTQGIGPAQLFLSYIDAISEGKWACLPNSQDVLRHFLPSNMHNMLVVVCSGRYSLCRDPSLYS